MSVHITIEYLACAEGASAGGWFAVFSDPDGAEDYALERWDLAERKVTIRQRDGGRIVETKERRERVGIVDLGGELRLAPEIDSFIGYRHKSIPLATWLESAGFLPTGYHQHDLELARKEGMRLVAEAARRRRSS